MTKHSKAATPASPSPTLLDGCCRSPTASWKVQDLVAAPASVHVRGLRQHDPLLPNFNTTFYTIRINSPLTASIWTTRHRFSAMAAHRKAIIALARACPSLSTIPLGTFPRRHLGQDDAFIVAEREVGLTAFVQALLDLRAQCLGWQTNGPTNPLLRTLRQRIEDILEIPDTHKKIEQRMKVYTDNDRHQDDHKPSACSICLDDFGDSTAIIVRLRCGHTYHHVCVSTWLQKHVSCPICRRVA